MTGAGCYSLASLQTAAYAVTFIMEVIVMNVNQRFGGLSMKDEILKRLPNVQQEF